MNILVVEDDVQMAGVLVDGLREESHNVSHATDGLSALRVSGQYSFDLILLDVMLPGMNGLEVTRQIRSRSSAVPVLMLTARDAVPDVVKGLDSGADDYLTKPFSFEELLARIRAFERRNAARPKSVLEVEDLLLDVNSFRLFRKGREIQLSLTEFRLLELLARHPGRVVSRQSIMDGVWGAYRDVEENTVDVFIRLPRKKIEEGFDTKLIHTHRGFGYSVGAPS